MTRVAAKETPPGSLLKQPKEDKPKARKPMRRQSQKRKDYWETPEGQFSLKYMGLVRELPCKICYEFDMKQVTRTEFHHVIHGRYSSRKSPHTSGIPLCVCHHRGTAGSDKIAIHAHPSLWQRLYGPDTDYTAPTQDAIERVNGIKVRG